MKTQRRFWLLWGSCILAVCTRTTIAQRDKAPAPGSAKPRECTVEAPLGGYRSKAVPATLIPIQESMPSPSPMNSDFDIALVLPDTHSRFTPGQRVRMARGSLYDFIIEVAPRVGHVRGESLRIMINDEGAAIYTTITSTEQGYRCAVQLKATGMVTLKPGNNVVSVVFTDTWNRPHRETFVLLLDDQVFLRQGLHSLLLTVFAQANNLGVLFAIAGLL